MGNHGVLTVRALRLGAESFETSMRYVHDRRELAPVVNLLPNITSRHHLRLI